LKILLQSLKPPALFSQLALWLKLHALIGNFSICAGDYVTYHKTVVLWGHCVYIFLF